MNTPPRRTWRREDCESALAVGLESSSFAGPVCWPTANASGPARASAKRPIRTDIGASVSIVYVNQGSRVTDLIRTCMVVRHPQLAHRAALDVTMSPHDRWRQRRSDGAEPVVSRAADAAEYSVSVRDLKRRDS